MKLISFIVGRNSFGTYLARVLKELRPYFYLPSLQPSPIEAVNNGKQKLGMFASKRGSEARAAHVIGRGIALCRVPARLESQAPVSVAAKFWRKKAAGRQAPAAASLQAD